MNHEQEIQIATEKFAELIRSEFQRIERMKADREVKDFSKLDKIVVGIMPGDGIGPIIMEQAIRVMKCLMKEEIASGRIELRHIEGMTIENRAAKNNSLPDECMVEIKKCDVLLKGPMVTPRAGECFPDGTPMPNLVSANSLLRRGLELFSAVRPIRIPDKGIDWTFFRENIEGEYIWGNKGIQVNEDLAVDFKVQTAQGSERIARAAFLKYFGLVPEEAIANINSFVSDDANFLELFIVLLITGSVLALDRDILLKSFAGYLPAILGGLVGYLVGFYPIDSALTAGLCMANRGGNGDIACLGAADRMDLIAYALLSSRLGGGIVLIIASYGTNIQGALKGKGWSEEAILEARKKIEEAFDTIAYQ